MINEKHRLTDALKNLKDALKNLIEYLKANIEHILLGFCTVCCLYLTWKVNQQPTQEDIESTVRNVIFMKELNDIIEESK
jgi:hypothetical protein